MSSSAALNFIDITYDDVGEGEVVVLVHGHPFNRSMWAPQLTALSESGYRAIAADLRGYGQTSMVAGTGTTTLDIFAQDIVALLDHLAIEKVAIVGLSMGGQIAMEFARQFPGRLRGLVLAATFPQAETADGIRARNAMADRLLREGMNGYAQEALPRMLAEGSIVRAPATTRSVLDMMRTTPVAGAAAALRGRALRPGYEEVLAQLDMPALVVVGDKDTFTSRQDADLMHRLLRRSRLVWMHDVGHMPNLEDTKAFDQELIHFLKATSNLEQGPLP